MKSFRRVPIFEQLEQKRLLAADSCEHEPAYAPDEAEPTPIAVAQVGAASKSFRASGELQNFSTTNGEQTENDDDETDDDETDDDETNSTATQPATTARVPLPETTVEQLLFAASESGLSRKSVLVSEAIQAEEAPTAADATRIDLLLAVTENDAGDGPVSTEFVGVSDQNDAAPTAMDQVFEALGEYAEPPVLLSGL